MVRWIASTTCQAALDPVTERGRDFARERANRAVAFTASLYLTAWQQSENVRLPGWLER